MMKLSRILLFAILVMCAEGSLIIKEIRIRCNYELINVTVKLFNDGVHDTIMNFTLQTFEVYEKIQITLKVNVPNSENDRFYQTELLRTSIDAKKIFQGVKGNFIIAMFTEPWFKALDFAVPKFPIQKGTYVANNFVISDNYIPFPVKTKALVECQYVAKVRGKKASADLYKWKAYVEVDRKLFNRA